MNHGKTVNHPEPTAERYVLAASWAHARARQWSETAVASGLEDLLSRSDRSALQDLIRKARGRQLLTSDGRDMIEWLAETCNRRITVLTDHNAPATRSRAMMLNDNAQELFALRSAIDGVLDLEAAIQALHRITSRT